MTDFNAKDMSRLEFDEHWSNWDWGCLFEDGTLLDAYNKLVLDKEIEFHDGAEEGLLHHGECRGIQRPFLWMTEPAIARSQATLAARTTSSLPTHPQWPKTIPWTLACGPADQ